MSMQQGATRRVLPQGSGGRSVHDWFAPFNRPIQNTLRGGGQIGGVEKTLFFVSSRVATRRLLAICPLCMFASSSPDVSLQQVAREGNDAPIGLLARVLLGPLSDTDGPGTRHTLLAVSPTSEAVARAALLAAEEAHTPLLYAATLDAVDRDGGYTGWTPESFASFVANEVDRLGIAVPVFVGLDRGGPWTKEAHAGQQRPGTRAMTNVQRSVTACVKAGYDLLHLDPGAGPHGDDNDPLPIDTLVDRTIELLRHAEDVRRAHGHDPIAYEVGTDAPRGGLDSTDRLHVFLRRLREKLGPNDLPRPAFVAGPLGATHDSDAEDTERTRQFVDLADKALGALLRIHTTDDAATPAEYPVAGVGGANVGPNLSTVEAEAVRDLVKLETRLGNESAVTEALRTAVIEDGRWTMWLRPTEQGRSFYDLPTDRQQWLVDTGSRYVWSNAEVQAARTELYENVAPYRDADAYVQWRLKNAILHYMHAFNLVGLTERIRDVLPESTPRSEDLPS